MVLYTQQQLESFTITDLKKIGNRKKVAGRSKWKKDTKSQAIQAILTHQLQYPNNPEEEKEAPVQRNVAQINVNTITSEEILQMNITNLKKLVKNKKIDIPPSQLKTFKKDNKDVLATMIIQKLNISRPDPIEALRQTVIDLYNELQQYPLDTQRNILAPYFILDRDEEKSFTPSPVVVVAPTPPAPSPMVVVAPPSPMVVVAPLSPMVVVAPPSPMVVVAPTPPAPSSPTEQKEEIPLDYEARIRSVESDLIRRPIRPIEQRGKIQILDPKDMANLLNKLENDNENDVLRQIPLIERNVQKCLGLID